MDKKKIAPELRYPLAFVSFAMGTVITIKAFPIVEVMGYGLIMVVFGVYLFV